MDGLKVTATAGFLMIYLVSDCKPYGNDPTDNPIQMYCNDGEQTCSQFYVFGICVLSVFARRVPRIGGHLVPNSRTVCAKPAS